jgi:hypothetical protein
MSCTQKDYEFVVFETLEMFSQFDFLKGTTLTFNFIRVYGFI